MTALSARQLELLQRVAHGASYRQVAADWGISEITVRGYGHRLLRVLGASSIAHAVHIAHSQGLIGPKPDCGTRAAYRRHVVAGEPTDMACRLANQRYWAECRETLAPILKAKKAATPSRRAAA
ncbi:helix-turn-helix transcriptional regulator [Streptomyces sp. PRKS01-29]|nr:helix-turn-helix transcriptional regulator [Streptomyces sabulosicollis]MBI0300463.1 helix-turn-helix transcriptional regulator [Streptomyces sabulosicollis]